MKIVTPFQLLNQLTDFHKILYDRYTTRSFRRRTFVIPTSYLLI